MCGIVAVSGTGDVSARCVEGLRRLQYRGYDSFGFALSQGGELERWRSTDPLEEMTESLPSAPVVTGHTRWATHGGVTLANAHPHLGPGNDFAVVHNGIVENYQSCRNALEYDFVTGTDTEVIVAMLAMQLGQGEPRDCAVASVFEQIEGRNTFVVQFADGEIYGIRHGSPLILGRADDAVYLASDVLSFAPYTDICCPVPERTAVRIRGMEALLFDDRGFREPEWICARIEKEEARMDGYRHFMLKEIMEQWRTVSQQALVQDGDFDALAGAIRDAGRVVVTGAGGASFAAKQIAWFLRDIAEVAAVEVAAYDFDSLAPCIAPGDVLVAVSQSGETADTIEAVRMAQGWGMRVATLVNMPMSSLSRMAEFVFYNRSGPEICVLSTKSASAQITFGYLLASAVSGELEAARANVNALSRVLSLYLTEGSLKEIKALAKDLSCQEHVFVLGRNAYLAVAQMAALNIKEASYVHAEAFSAGELKHGVIALIETGTPVILFVEAGDKYMLNAAAEVKSRGAKVIAVSTGDNELFDSWIPLPGDSADVRAIAGIIPCQLLAYFLATERGLNPDKPRNLAKSVTVQ